MLFEKGPSFLSDASQRAWRVVRADGRALMAQVYTAPLEERSRTHPMLVAGDPAWSDYTLETRFAPATTDGRSGVVFRYRHDRAHYFAGVEAGEARLEKVNEGAAFRKLAETVLARAPFSGRAGEFIRLRVAARGDLFDARGEPYHDFEPAQHGSMMLPVNWTGRPGECWVLSPSVVEGGLFDGWGRRAVRFPADGHPDLCYDVRDLTGDCRDEIVVWDPYELWVYTQSDGPLSGRLYEPKRNPPWNASNYQATVSLPGWSE